MKKFTSTIIGILLVLVLSASSPLQISNAVSSIEYGYLSPSLPTYVLDYSNSGESVTIFVYDTNEAGLANSADVLTFWNSSGNWTLDYTEIWSYTWNGPFLNSADYDGGFQFFNDWDGNLVQSTLLVYSDGTDDRIEYWYDGSTLVESRLSYEYDGYRTDSISRYEYEDDKLVRINFLEKSEGKSLPNGVGNFSYNEDEYLTAYQDDYLTTLFFYDPVPEDVDWVEMIIENAPF
jgi:hypothetical protein